MEVKDKIMYFDQDTRLYTLSLFTTLIGKRKSVGHPADVSKCPKKTT
jgi:hypothetical protein